MTPENIMSALNARGPLPREALLAAGQSREAMVPAFLAYIDRVLDSDADQMAELDAFAFIFHLLGEWRDARAYRPLAKVMRLDPEALDALLGDGITETSARVMAGVFDGDPGPLFEIILDDSADGFARGEMFDALTMLALQDPALRPPITEFLQEFFDAAGPDTGEEVWSAWVFCIAALGLSNMTLVVRSVFESGLIEPDHTSFSEFEQALADTLHAKTPTWFLRQTNKSLITDTIGDLSRWYCFSDEFLKKKARAQQSGMPTPGPIEAGPFFAPDGPKLGRNDLCLCGSGKKFKKCCLH